MIEIRSWWANGITKAHLPKPIVVPKPAYPPGDLYKVSESAVAWGRLWYSLRVLIFGKTAADARMKRAGIKKLY